MKTIFLISLIIVAFGNNVISQPCNSQTMQSPVSKKPTAPGIALVNCNTLQLKWQGNTGQTYILNATVKDAATGKIIKANAASNIQQNGLNYTANIPVTAGTKVSWTVQGISIINNRTFYSYPLRGGKDFVIPNCPSTVVTASDTNKDNAVAVTNNKIAVRMFPNPVQSTLNLQLSSNSISQKTISIYNVYGKTIISQRSTENNMQVDVKQLVSGVYFIKILDTNGKELFNGKFIKM